MSSKDRDQPILVLEDQQEEIESFESDSQESQLSKEEELANAQQDLKKARRTIATLIEQMSSFKEAMSQEIRQYEEALLIELADTQEELERRTNQYTRDKEESIQLLTDMAKELDSLAEANEALESDLTQAHEQLDVIFPRMRALNAVCMRAVECVRVARTLCADVARFRVCRTLNRDTRKLFRCLAKSSSSHPAAKRITTHRAKSKLRCSAHSDECLRKREINCLRNCCARKQRMLNHCNDWNRSKLEFKQRLLR
jgi:hypothetical protein